MIECKYGFPQHCDCMVATFIGVPLHYTRQIYIVPKLKRLHYKNQKHFVCKHLRKVAKKFRLHNDPLS